MIKDFDKVFKELIDESIPRVMLTRRKENKETKSEDNIFVKEYCEEY